jgi:pyruvate kinase
MRKGKIVCTLGPKSQDRTVIKQLIKAGMNVARINMSHGSHEDAGKIFSFVREVANELSLPVAIMIDLQGPKIRLGSLETDDYIVLQDRATFTITTEDIIGNAKRASTTFKGLPKDCKPGDKILLNDGKVELKVLNVTKTDVECEVVHGGEIGSHKGINLPGVAVSIPALSDKDREDLVWALEQGADLIALSFVRYAQDYNDALAIMKKTGIRRPILAKLEKPQGIANLKEIIETFDAFMVARGDLGVEMSEEKVPIVQKDIIEKARSAGKPVIVATHMLESMVNAPVPTRAETSDVANAILDGADATMLSEETSVGNFPVDSVETMATISNYQTDLGVERIPTIDLVENSKLSATAISVVNESQRSKHVRAIVIFASTGHTARLISALRPEVPIIAITDNMHTFRTLNLSWGITPKYIDSSIFTTPNLSLVDIAASNARAVLGNKISGRLLIVMARWEDVYLINHQLS